MRTLRLPLVGAVMLMLLGGPGSVIAAEEGAGPAVDGQAIAEMVSEAVASCGDEGCDQAVVEAAYAPDIRWIIDGVVRADGLDEGKDFLRAVGRSGNSYRLLAPVAEYRARDGDLFVALFVEVTGSGHPQGDPIVSLMQVRDGKVIRQVDTTPPFGWAARPAMLEGTEAYEGLSALLWITLPAGWDMQEPGTVEGVIYEGSAPRLEWPEAEASPAE